MILVQGGRHLGGAPARRQQLDHHDPPRSRPEDLEAVARLNARFSGLEVILIESGGDNLAATFSPELSDLTLYVIDVAAGDKIPRKGGPGICKSDLLIINKIDLAPMVGASLEVMERDAKKMRGERPFVFSNMKTGQSLDAIIDFIEREGMLGKV